MAKRRLTKTPLPGWYKGEKHYCHLCGGMGYEKEMVRRNGAMWHKKCAKLRKEDRR